MVSTEEIEAGGSEAQVILGYMFRCVGPSQGENGFHFVLSVCLSVCHSGKLKKKKKNLSMLAIAGTSGPRGICGVFSSQSAIRLNPTH